MKSPFPVMDPYLEGRWGGVHTALRIGIRSALQPVLPACSHWAATGDKGGELGKQAECVHSSSLRL